MLKKHQKFFGYACLALAQLAVATHIIVSKILVKEYNISASVIIYFRFALAAIFLYLICVFTKTKVIEYKFFTVKKYKDLLFLLFLQGLCGGLVFNFLVLHGLNFTTAAAAGIVSSSLPAILAIMSAVILQERLNKYKILSIILATVGMICLSYAYIEINFLQLVGMFLVFIAMVPESLYTIVGKEIEGKFNDLQAATLVTMINAIVVLPVIGYYWYLNGFEILNITSLSLLSISGICSALFFLLWPMGLKCVDGSTAGLFTALMPVFTVLLSYIWLGEQLYLYEILGMLFVMTAIMIGSGIIKIGSFHKVRHKRNRYRHYHKKHK